MSKHTHQFVETYDGLLGWGLDRETDEATLRVYLQKFSDDALMDVLLERLSDGEIEETFQLVCRLLKTHLADEEYHRFFLKD